MKYFKGTFFAFGMVLAFLTAVIVGCGTNSSGTAGGGSSTNLTGTWNGNYQSTGSVSGSTNYSGPLNLSLSQSGSGNVVGSASGSFTGQYNGSATTGTFTSQPVSGTVNGLSANLNILFGSQQVNLIGTVSSDTTTLTGTWTGDFTGAGSDQASGTWTCLLVSQSTS